MLPKGRYEVVIRNATQSKTLQQLGGLFGVWLNVLSNETGNDEDYLHRMLKAKFLCPIYLHSPHNDRQLEWAEALVTYKLNEDFDKYDRQAKRLSLSWASKGQYSEYMKKIEVFYINQGITLPKLEKVK